MKTPNQLAQHGIKINWFQYNQLRLEFNKDKKKDGIESNWTEFDKVILGGEKGFIKKTYKFLLNIMMEEETIKESMVKWMQNIGKEISFKMWENSWINTQKFTKCNTLKENFIKVFHRWYLTPTRLAKMNKNCSHLCWKCRREIGTIYHMWWKCREVQKYWRKIHKEIQEVTKFNIPLSPELFLLNMTDVISGNLKNEFISVVLYLITAARMVLARYWKSPILPNILDWKSKVQELVIMDQLTLFSTDKSDQVYEEKWKRIRERWFL